jgi:aspartyl-tRNA(Asn)/glutamyl-tRNA(Gln) amidotransferase subunit B
VRTGVALGCEVKKLSVWSRKNYFYPDLPKGYQISQYDLPICENGTLRFDLEGAERSVRIRRIHMEEDAGKSVHDAEGGESWVDLNRAGVPLLEIVSEPDLRSSEEAVEYLKALRDILVYLGVNDGNLEEGSFRCDANVSVMRKGATEFGTRAELKNINSFRFIRQAIDFEINRQIELVESGGKVVQQTRLFDSQRGETRAMRSKEEAHDYRYFPEPDLLPLRLESAFIDQQRGELPELPRARWLRLQSQYSLPAHDARFLCAEGALVDFFEATAAHYPEYRKLSNWLQGEFARLLKEQGGEISALKLTPVQLASLLGSVDKGEISANAAKEVLGEMFRTGKEPASIIQERGLVQVSDTGALEAAVDEVLAKNPGEIEKYQAGKKQILGFLVGQVMKLMKGKGNPALINALVRKKIGD